MKIMLILLVAILSIAECSKILIVFPFASRSHYTMGSSLAKGLVEAGHDVTMVSTFGEKNPPTKNGTYRDIVLTGLKEEQEESNKQMNLFDFENLSPFIGMLFMVQFGPEMSEKALNHPNFQQLLHSGEEFDVVIVEVFYNNAVFGVAHHFKAPLILFSTVGPCSMVNSLVGNPSPPSYIPDIFTQYTSKMTFFQRVYTWIFRLMSGLTENILIMPMQNRVMKKYLPDVPDLSVINHNASIILLNYHESIGQPVPHVPSLIDIGGIHIKPSKKLPKDLKDFMDNAEEGVVYFSLGSNIRPSEMPDEKKQVILKVLGKIKQKVLWKWDEDNLPGQPENVKISKWFPQQDILAHPNIKLFITHGGLLSTTETIYHGIPILALSIFGDQKANAAQAENNGYGLHLPFSKLTEETFSNNIEKLLNDPKYRENAKRRSALMHDRPMKPLDFAVYWVEFVIRHRGASHLRVAGVDLPWYKYLLLDVIAFVFLVTLCVFYVLYIIFKKLCCRKNNPKVKTN